MTRRPSARSLARSRALFKGAAPLVTVVALVATTGTAAADEKCPPGSWFCADGEVKIGTPDQPTPAPTPAPTPTPAPPPQPPPPVVIYQPAPPPPVYAGPPPSYYPPPPPPPQRPRSEVGLSFRIEGAAFHAADTYKGGDVGMGGVGMSLRFRPTPRFALDIGLDALAGIDANGKKRSETPISVLGLLYLNPRSRVQVYLLGGFAFSGARVEDRLTGQVEHYSYFGGMFGGGLEFRLSRKVALNFDIRGFIRGRTDDQAARNPEFTAADGRTTNTSGGALFTGGLTFYF
jgi:hypothetical protein